MMLSDYNIDVFDRWYNCSMGALGVVNSKVPGSSDLPEEYDKFEDRPEYRVGRPVRIEDHTLDELAES